MPRNRALLNLVDSALSSLATKGNLGYADELYNPANAFEQVHHISFFRADRDIRLGNPTIQIHVLRTSYPWLPVLWPLVDLIGGFFQILWIARRNRVALIRGRGAHAASFYGLLVSRVLRIPLVVSIGAESNRVAWDLGGRYPILRSKRLSYFVEETVLRGATMVFSPNRYIHDYLIKLGVRPANIRIVPLRLLSDIFDSRSGESTILIDRGIDLDKPIVLYVGRLAPDKSVNLVVEAMPFVLKERSDAQFVVVGDGVLRGDLERRVKELSLSEHVFFLGYQSSDVIKYCLTQATAIWIPKTGFVMFEAAAMSAPIVAFDVEWQSEFVTHEHTGLLVPFGDVQELARAVLQFIANPEWGRQLGTNARAKLDADFTPRSITARELACYRELIGDVTQGAG